MVALALLGRGEADFEDRAPEEELNVTEEYYKQFGAAWDDIDQATEDLEEWKT